MPLSHTSIIDQNPRPMTPAKLLAQWVQPQKEEKQESQNAGALTDVARGLEPHMQRAANATRHRPQVIRQADDADDGERDHEQRQQNPATPWGTRREAGEGPAAHRRGGLTQPQL